MCTVGQNQKLLTNMNVTVNMCPKTVERYALAVPPPNGSVKTFNNRYGKVKNLC